MAENTNSYLLISPLYPPPHIGGSKVWTFNMAENCPANLDILTSALKKGYEEISSSRHHVFRSSFIWDSVNDDPTHKDLLISYGYILQWLFKRSFQVKYKAVIAGAFDFANGFIILLCRILGIPVIALGNAEEFTLTLKGKGIRKWIKRAWLKFTHKKANGFIVVCHFCKDILASIGVKPETIHVVPSSINPDKLKQTKDRIFKGTNILSVGRLVERKGFHLLIEAVKRLKTEIPDIRLTIVGEGPYKKILEEKILREQLQNFIFLKGSLSDEALSSLYQESDLFVLAHMMLENGDTEGCPTVFSEASGSGLPVIGGMEGGASTVILDGETGYIVDSRNIDQLADRIRRILTDSKLATKMGQAGIKKVRREHTPETTGLAFYEAILKITSSTMVEASVAEQP